VHLGGNGAAHGGTVPLVWDDLLGRLVNTHHGTRARTAFLHVNYRQITPVGPELTFEIQIKPVDGRKRWATGQMFDPDGVLVNDAEGLFVQLLPGQP
jgi:hypothetical protein